MKICAWIIYTLLSAESLEGEKVERSWGMLFSSEFTFTLNIVYWIVLGVKEIEFHCIRSPLQGLRWSESLLTCCVGVSRTEVVQILASVHTLLKTYGAYHLFDRSNWKVKHCCVRFCAISHTHIYTHSADTHYCTYIVSWRWGQLRLDVRPASFALCLAAAVTLDHFIFNSDVWLIPFKFSLTLDKAIFIQEWTPRHGRYEE